MRTVRSSDGSLSRSRDVQSRRTRASWSTTSAAEVRDTVSRILPVLFAAAARLTCPARAGGLSATIANRVARESGSAPARCSWCAQAALWAMRFPTQRKRARSGSTGAGSIRVRGQFGSSAYLVADTPVARALVLTTSHLRPSRRKPRRVCTRARARCRSITRTKSGRPDSNRRRPAWEAGRS
jgi:hypothetical protein